MPDTFIDEPVQIRYVNGDTESSTITAIYESGFVLDSYIFVSFSAVQRVELLDSAEVARYDPH